MLRRGWIGTCVISKSGFKVRFLPEAGEIIYREGSLTARIDADRVEDETIGFLIADDVVWRGGGTCKPLTDEDKRRITENIGAAIAFLGWRVRGKYE